MARKNAEERSLKALQAKAELQAQMIERERMRQTAYEEYAKERAGVDAIINRMVAEDHESLRIQK